MNELYIVGSGIKFLSHLTLEAKALINEADCVLYLLNETAMKHWVVENSKKAISLDDIYFSSEKRTESYRKIASKVIDISLQHRNTCFVIYGHPLVLCEPVVKIIRSDSRQSNKLRVNVLPGISSLDCLFSDLEVDPGEFGIQAFEATNFVTHDYDFSIHSNLVLWQIGVSGITSIVSTENEQLEAKRLKSIALITKKLLKKYDWNHEVYLYVAAQYPQISCEIQKIKLCDLPNVSINRLATAYIPPLGYAKKSSKVLKDLS